LDLIATFQNLSTQPVPIKRPIFRYCVLVFLFITTILYEVRYTKDIIHGESTYIASFTLNTASNKVGSVTPEAARAGIHMGDLLVAVNGVPYTGTGVLGDAFAHARPGVPIVVSIISGDPAKPGQRTVSVAVSRVPVRFRVLAEDLVRYFLLPGMSLLLGFWVAFVRPRDPLAWLLLVLMMAFPHIVGDSKIPGWDRDWREAGMLYHTTLSFSFPIVIFLFGRFFPEPFPKGSRYDLVWEIVQWIVGLPFALLGLETIIVLVAQLSDYKSVAALYAFFTPLDRMGDAMVYLLIGTFIAAMGIKLGQSKSPDARRRLLFVYWGATVALGPVLLLTIYSKIIGKSAFEVFSEWLVLLSLALLVVFPLTLAYVIVVQKAMAVGVAVRQGLQYALAKNGLRVLQALVMGAILVLAIGMVDDATRNRPQKITAIALGIAAVLTIRRTGGRLRTWIDRRFFREAYNSEQVLSDLSEQVRHMVELEPLLETVAARISETLHVPQVAVLLGASELYQPVVALGYGNLPNLAFQRNAGTARILQRQKDPAHVFLNDRDSWLYREEDMDEGERDKLATLHSELLLPLAVREKLLGFISLGAKRSEEPYTGSDVRLLKSVAVQTGLALENAELMREVASQIVQRERMNREVEIAREVQERLFPQKLLVIAGLDYAGHCRPALGVGGDYYDFLALSRGHLGIAIADVSGKGIAAALMMASLQASLRGEATRAPENLASVVANVNRLVYEVSSDNRYATFFYGQYHPITGQFDYVNAGHNPPMLFHRAHGKWTVTHLDVGGVVVGLLESYLYQQGRVLLVPGDILVAYTDGISEATNSADEEWGEDRVMEVIQQCDGLPAQEILQRVFAAADAFVAGAEQHDDMTLVILRVVP
jgi:sigma-B regulation protein RsbU (phosphoserine phosphatase)